MPCSPREIQDIRNDERDGAGEEYGLVHAEMPCHRTAREDSRADTDIPSAQVRAVRGAALVVAGEVHAHRLVTREYKPEARANQERSHEERYGRMAEGENEICNYVQCHACTHKVNQVAPVDEPAGHDAVQDKPCGNKRVEPAGPSDAEFLRVERDVVRDGPVGEPHEDEVHELRDGAGEEETVERKRRMRFLFLAGDVQCLHENEADDTQDDGNREHDGVPEGLVQEHACHRAGRECEIHANPEITDAFPAAACRERVNGHRIACGTRNPEEETVGEPHCGKDRQNAYGLVAQEARGEREERPEVKRLAAEGIHEESGEGPAGERTDGIERDDKTCSRIVRRELLDDVQREDRQQLVETEEQQKVRGGDRHEVACPECWFLCCIRHIKYPGGQR